MTERLARAAKNALEKRDKLVEIATLLKDTMSNGDIQIVSRTYAHNGVRINDWWIAERIADAIYGVIEEIDDTLEKMDENYAPMIGYLEATECADENTIKILERLKNQQ